MLTRPLLVKVLRGSVPLSSNGSPAASTGGKSPLDRFSPHLQGLFKGSCAILSHPVANLVLAGVDPRPVRRLVHRLHHFPQHLLGFLSHRFDERTRANLNFAQLAFHDRLLCIEPSTSLSRAENGILPENTPSRKNGHA